MTVINSKKPIIALSALALGLCPLGGVAYAQEQEAQEQEAEAIDPARLEIATQLADTVFPDGVYQELMGEQMQSLMRPIVDQAQSMPLAELLKSMNILSADEIAALDGTSSKDIMAIIMPGFSDKMNDFMGLLYDEMGALMTQLEPDVRAGLSRAYAREFSLAELQQIEQFFGTEAGEHYASQTMFIFMSPEVMQILQQVMPMIVEETPVMIGRVMEKMGEFPKPRKISDLSDDERAQLANLLGISVEELENGAQSAEQEDEPDPEYWNG